MKHYSRIENISGMIFYYHYENEPEKKLNKKIIASTVGEAEDEFFDSINHELVIIDKKIKFK